MKFSFSHIQAGNSELFLPQTLKNMFWETGSTQDYENPELDRALWLTTVVEAWGNSGLAYLTQEDTSEVPEVAGNIFYGPRYFFPGIEQMDSGPISADAIFVGPVFHTMDEQNPRCIQTILNELTQNAKVRGIHALETYGLIKDIFSYTDEEKQFKTLSEAESVDYEEVIGIPVLDVETLLENGFAIVSNHRTYPRLRKEIKTEETLFSQASKDIFTEEIMATVLGVSMK